MKKCSVENCNNQVYCKGVCIKHYRHIQRYGKIKTRTRQDKNEIKIIEGKYAEVFIYNISCEVVAKAKVSLESLDFVRKYKWCLAGDGYLVAGSNRKLVLHRMLLGNPKGKVVDHINGDTLDNRLDNLRVATQQQNCFNRTKVNSSTGYKGVYKCNKTGKYKASITISGKYKYLGTYVNIEDAIKARKKAEKKYFKEFSN